MPRRALQVLLFAAAVTLAAAPGALAQAEDLRTLDRTFRDIAHRAIPATVLVKSTLNDGSGRAGFGSGAIVSEDGYVLTCAHVVEIAGDVEVTLSSGKTFKARLLGKNSKQDYALLKVEAHGLATFPIGDSSKVGLGDWVVALGHPGGPYPDLRPAFSVGRVTGLHRRLPVQMMDRFYDDAIRTDAPIFAGNSGGPLVNLKGELIGLNGAILLINENSYAVPINEVAAHLDALKSGELVEGRAPTGGRMAPFDEFEGDDLAKFMGKAGRRLFGKDGIGKVFRGKGETGDEVARAFDRLGKALEDEKVQGMLRDLFGSGPGGGDDRNAENPFGGFSPDKLKDMLDALRGKGGDRPETPPAPRPPVAAEEPLPRAYLGLRAADGDEAAGLRGVLVEEVVPASPAAQAGLEAGDVILSVGGRRTTSGPDLARALAGRVPGERVDVRVLRTEIEDGVPVERERTLTVALGEREKE